jgi:hypothetical protein
MALFDLFDNCERRIVFEAFDQILLHMMICTGFGGRYGSGVGEIEGLRCKLLAWPSLAASI